MKSPVLKGFVARKIVFFPTQISVGLMEIFHFQSIEGLFLCGVCLVVGVWGCFQLVNLILSQFTSHLLPFLSSFALREILTLKKEIFF